MSAHNALTTWILHDNLRLFLERVSARISYRFEDWDWDAIRFGVGDSDFEHDQWYEYELIGQPPVTLAFADAGDGKRLHVSVETEERTATRIEALARIMRCYEETGITQDLEMLVQAAFIDTPEPDQGKVVACNAAHLAVCLECQEAQAFFSGRHWMELLRGGEPLPCGVADLTFLTDEARRFFFPAYLVKALRDKDDDLLETALHNVEQELWAPLQQELIEFAMSLMQIGT